jgi:hypothetical protein
MRSRFVDQAELQRRNSDVCTTPYAPLAVLKTTCRKAASRVRQTAHRTNSCEDPNQQTYYLSLEFTNRKRKQKINKNKKIKKKSNPLSLIELVHAPNSTFGIHRTGEKV